MTGQRKTVLQKSVYGDVPTHTQVYPILKSVCYQHMPKGPGTNLEETSCVDKAEEYYSYETNSFKLGGFKKAVHSFHGSGVLALFSQVLHSGSHRDAVMALAKLCSSLRLMGLLWMHVLVGRTQSPVFTGLKSLLPCWLLTRSESQPQGPLTVLLGVTHSIYFQDDQAFHLSSPPF